MDGLALECLGCALQAFLNNFMVSSAFFNPKNIFFFCHIDLEKAKTKNTTNEHNNGIHSSMPLSQLQLSVFLIPELFPSTQLFPTAILLAWSVSVALCSRTKKPASKPSLSLQGPRIHIPPRTLENTDLKNKNTIRDKISENKFQRREVQLMFSQRGCINSCSPISSWSSIRPSPQGFPMINCA